MRKVADYRREHAENRNKYQHPDALYIRDQLRFTISTGDPMLAAMCVHGMQDFTNIGVVPLQS